MAETRRKAQPARANGSINGTPISSVKGVDTEENVFLFVPNLIGKHYLYMSPLSS